MPQLSMLKICLKVHEPVLLETLEELLPQAGVSIKTDESDAEALLFTSQTVKSDLPSLDFLSLSKPMRFVDFLSLLENLPYSQEITFSHYSLDLRERILKNLQTFEDQRLTGKECQLLRFFHQNKGEELPKERILTEIWGYHPETQTHTLETHIYRLRQKLEEDPNVPKILLNGKKGYWIK